MSLLPVPHNFSKLGNSHPAVELILENVSVGSIIIPHGSQNVFQRHIDNPNSNSIPTGIRDLSEYLARTLLGHANFYTQDSPAEKESNRTISMTFEM